VNNLRDIPTDSAAGKRTLAVRIGAARSRQLLAATAAAAFLVPIIAAAVGAMPRLAAIVAVTAPLAIRPVRIAATSTGRALVPALIALSRLELAFGAVLCAALLAS